MHVCLSARNTSIFSAPICVNLVKMSEITSKFVTKLVTNITMVVLLSSVATFRVVAWVALLPWVPASLLVVCFPGLALILLYYA
jgi:hypothetical protein